LNTPVAAAAAVACMHAPFTSAPFLRSSFTHSGLSEMQACEMEL
jgi:hypothetical protein